ncbi:MAG: hypothetical protein MZU97_26470 [Bacillus subtilis]|nr:hypothetical protein [Bacillus subtilis]
MSARRCRSATSVALGLEFQTLSEEGIIGIERINTAVVGRRPANSPDSVDDPTIRGIQLSPTFFPLTKTESDLHHRLGDVPHDLHRQRADHAWSSSVSPATADR